MSTKSPNPTDTYVGKRVRMRRLMLGMSQAKLGNAVGLTFQQIHKYEKGTCRIGGSRLQQFAHILHVPIPFFFEGLPQISGTSEEGAAASLAYVDDFLATSDGRSLIKSFIQIKHKKLRGSIVDLVEEIAARYE
jgi:transcriptional regulator with XRE-family HTH domain